MNNNEFKNKIINTLEMNTDYFKLDLNDGVKLIINENAPDINYKIDFIDNKSNTILYTTVIQKNMWTALSFKYYVDCSVVIENYETKEIIKKLDTNLKNKVVKIILDSSALGDTLAWIPYADEFRKKHNCKLYVFTFHNEWFENQYPEINFINNIDFESFATYRIGWYYDENDNIKYDRNPTNFREQPMQKTSTDILGLEYKEIKPKINITKKEVKKKKVGIAIHGTSQVKYWNRENGWQEVVDFLNMNDYEVVLYSIENDGYMGNKHPSGITQFPKSDILTVATDISECEFFIGIPSGLSWLSWAVDTPVILISGFTKHTEFGDKIYIGNNVSDSDKHCFNRARMNPNDWNWCICEPKFSCSSNITPNQVIESIKKNFISEKSDFDWGWLRENDPNQQYLQLEKEIFIDRIYERFFEVEEGDVVIDIGASVGPFTKSILDKNPSKVICIEPSSIEFPTLENNFKNDDNVILVNAAIGSETKSGIINNEIFGDDKKSEQITFKSLINTLDINRIDFMKIDCEGGEYDIFTPEYITTLLGIPKIVVEFHLGTEEHNKKFRHFRDNILKHFKVYNVHSLDGVDIKWDLMNEHFLEYYKHVIFYFDNKWTKNDVFISNQNVYMANSNIHRVGVFAGKDFEINEIIEVCPILEIPEGYNIFPNYRFNYPFGSDKPIQTLAMGYGSFYNHSDDNNAAWFSEENNLIKAFIFYAVKPIKKGEEIFTYYGDDDYFKSRNIIKK